MSGSGDAPKPPLSVLPGGGTRDQRAELLRNLTATNWDEEEKIQALVARWKKVQFDGLVAAGFTPDQALELVK